MSVTPRLRLSHPGSPLTLLKVPTAAKRTVSFQRTVRVADHGETNGLPRSLSTFTHYKAAAPAVSAPNGFDSRLFEEDCLDPED